MSSYVTNRLTGLFLAAVLPFSLFSQLTFTNVAGVGADQSDIGFNKDGGCSFADYDLDGDLDLVVNTNDNSSTRRSFLLRNDNGVFTDVTSTVAPGLKASMRSERSAAWGDCNNDGYPDLIVNTFGRYKILLNDAGTSFSIHTNTTSITDGINTEGLGWFDYDNDGDLDYFVENDSHGIDVFQNNGATPTPVFNQVTIDAIGPAGSGSGGLGLPEGGSTDGDYASAVDLNRDGYVDIIARRRNNGPNDGQDNNPYDIFLNDGDGTFTPNTSFNEWGNNNDKGSILTGDFDNDGDFDIIWTSGSTDGGRAVLYENTGSNSMNFVLVPNPFTLDDGSAFTLTDTEGAAMGDIDHDGDIDVFMTRIGGGTNHLFLNNSTGAGNFAFRQPGPTWIPGAAVNYGINVSGNGQGCVFADFDNDGDVDLYVNRNGQANQLWRNDYIGSAAESAATYQNNYLRIIPLIDQGGGITSPAMNAVVRFLDCDGNVIGALREIGSGGAGHGSQASPWLIYGLPDGPDASYIMEVQFTRDGTTPVTVQRSVLPSELAPISLGASTLTLEQTVIITDTDADDITTCPEDCLDGMDNDGDGLADCNDPECNLRGNGYDWFFGQNAGLDFENASGPVQVPSPAMNTDEGCAQWSDSSGKMLFYTNGVTVYNRFHEAMPNGTGLAGNPSATQSGVIVEEPGSPNRYYVFTIDSSPFEVRYSIVDMSLDGGKGDLVLASKNTLIQTVNSENIAAWPHANGIDYWIVVTSTNALHSYQLSPAGLGTVINSTATSSGRRFGYMKFSPDGSRIAVPSYPLSGTEEVHLYDFDSSTGLFSNKVVVPHTQPYGIEFSPNGRLLYVSEMGWAGSGALYQYVLEGNISGAAIAASATQLLTDNYMHGALQYAPDGKIYMATAITGNNPRNGLAVINSPNTQGIGANAVADQITFTGGARSRSGLPNIPYYQLATEPVISVVNATDTCLANGDIDLTVFAADAVSYQWLLNGSPIPGQVSDTYTASTFGEYSAVAIYACNSDTSSVIEFKLDSDSDCVSDDIDLDDDNDGILDANECKVYQFTTKEPSKWTITAANVNTSNIGLNPQIDNITPRTLDAISNQFSGFGNTLTFDDDPEYRFLNLPIGVINSGVFYDDPDDVPDAGAVYEELQYADTSWEIESTFDLTGFDFSLNPNFTLSGEFYSDDSMEIYINGNLVGTPSNFYYDDPEFFTISLATSGVLVASQNTLRIVVTNNPNSTTGLAFNFDIDFGCNSDIDNDGTANHLDPDSDGDGCNDVTEAGFTDANEDGEVDGTGIAADGTVIGSDGYTGTDPLVTDPSMVPAGCGEDNDADGVTDAFDLDDDNDGILDTEECGSGDIDFSSLNFTGQVVTLTSGNTIEVNGALTAVTSSSASGDAIGNLRLSDGMNALPNPPDYSVGDLYELDFLTPIYMTVSNMTAGIAGFDGLFAGGDEWRVTADGGFYINDPDGQLSIQLVGADFVEFRPAAGTAIGPGAGTWSISTRDAVSAATVQASGNPASAVNVSISCGDTDGDGTADHIDTDSDNDGCFDASEAGFTDDNGDGVLGPAPVTVDSDGLVTSGADGYTGTNAIVTDPVFVALSCDTDGDGISTSYDIDDDNDGISDIQEQDCTVSPPAGLGTPTIVDGGTRVSRIYTDFAGYWSSSVSANNPIQPNTNHNLLAFETGGVTFATGVSDDNMLDDDGDQLIDGIDTDNDGLTEVAAVESRWFAIPPSIDITNEIVIEPALLDGTLAALGPVLVNDVATDILNSYLTTGENGLNLGTSIANVGDSYFYNVTGVSPNAADDGVPDLLITQVAQATGVEQIVTFYDIGGNVVGNAVRVNATSGELAHVVGSYRCDVYFPSGSGTQINTPKDIRMASLEFSEFGLDESNVGNIAIMQLELTANADIGFLAYNQASFESICADIDSDGDGVFDRFDLDSDNDGIYDVVEGGDGDADTNNDGRVETGDTGFVDADFDGMADSAEPTPPTDSDGDGIPDKLELDSDNDGCNDITEAGYDDPDSNGILGDD